MKKKFQILINDNQHYYVYPHLESMVEKPQDPKVRLIIDRALEGRSIPISRRVILYHYFEKIINNLEKVKHGGFTKEEIQKAFENGLTDYSKEYAMNIYKNPLEQLSAAQNELAELKKVQSEIEAAATKYQSRMLYLVFTNCAIQLGGMAYLIFGLYSWEVMESVTYMVCKYGSFNCI